MNETITPERQIAASQVGAVFNSLHEYLRTLEPKDAENRPLLTKQLEFAHCRVDEAAMWAIKSVLTFGIPPVAKPAESVAAANEGVPAAAVPAETPAPIGVVDPVQPAVDAPAPVATDSASGTESV